MGTVCKIKDEESLQILFEPAEKIINIKKTTSLALAQSGLDQVIKILLKFPMHFRDRGFDPNLDEEKCLATVKFYVKSKSSFRNIYTVKGLMETKKSPLENLTIKFFSRPYFWTDLKKGETFYVSGLMSWEKRRGIERIMFHPDYVEKALEKIPRVEPVYLCALKNQTYIRIVNRLLERIQWEVPDWQSNSKFSFMDAVKKLHEPLKGEEKDKLAARLRLLRDEMLAYRFIWKAIKMPDGASKILFQKMPCKLPFLLSPSQRGALKEIKMDVESGRFMFRLLQGDVASGKTMVAFVSMIQAALNGYSACLMAPTQVLARQHYENLKGLLAGTPIRCKYLSSKVKEGGLEVKGTLFVGTHALFQKNTSFENLGLIIIDEQHRFGVTQRFNLFQKGCKSHILMMSATPIPRTLFLSSYCGLKSSRLENLPTKKPVEVSIISQNRVRDLIQRLKVHLQKGMQMYWICPFVEGDYASVKRRFQDVGQCFRGRGVQVLYGGIKPREKDAILKGFIEGKIQILIATSVVEVGINVPNANLIVIENPEVFGLVQLHQLRGRVGRGKDKGTCILLYGNSISKEGKERLKLIKKLDDGLALAREDLKMRGKGKISGGIQSGQGIFNFGSLDEAEAQMVDHNVSALAKSFLLGVFGPCS